MSKPRPRKINAFATAAMCGALLAMSSGCMTRISATKEAKSIIAASPQATVLEINDYDMYSSSDKVMLSLSGHKNARAFLTYVYLDTDGVFTDAELLLHGMMGNGAPEWLKIGDKHEISQLQSHIKKGTQHVYTSAVEKDPRINADANASTKVTFRAFPKNYTKRDGEVVVVEFVTLNADKSKTYSQGTVPIGEKGDVMPGATMSTEAMRELYKNVKEVFAVPAPGAAAE